MATHKAAGQALAANQGVADESADTHIPSPFFQPSKASTSLRRIKKERLIRVNLNQEKTMQASKAAVATPLYNLIRQDDVKHGKKAFLKKAEGTYSVKFNVWAEHPLTRLPFPSISTFNIKR